MEKYGIEFFSCNLGFVARRKELRSMESQFGD